MFYAEYNSGSTSVRAMRYDGSQTAKAYATTPSTDTW
jgi:hypothetical protein